MDFSHYNDASVQLAVDLVNTFERVSQTDRLITSDDLQAFLAEYDEEFKSQIWWEGTPTDEDVAEVRSLRERLGEVWDCGEAGPAISILNDLLKHSARPRISMHAGREPHFHFDPGDGPLAQWLAAATAMALGAVIVNHGYERFGSCGSSTCNDVYVDSSKNRSRRHCSSTCTTRENVAAHRRRAKESVQAEKA